MLTVEKQPLLNREKWILWSSLAKTIFKVRSGDAHWITSCISLRKCFVCVFLEGYFHLDPDSRRNRVQNECLIAGRRSAVVVPYLPLPATPPSSTVNPTPPLQNTLHPSDSAAQQSQPNTVPPSPSSDPRPAPEEERDEVQEREPQPDVVSITETDWKLHPGPAGPERSLSPASTVSHGSLSDLSRPPSSLFSRSTDLSSGRSSVLSGKTSGKLSAA